MMQHARAKSNATLNRHDHHRRRPQVAARAGGGARLSRPGAIRRRPAQNPPPPVAAVATSADRQREDNPLTVGLVALLTESLRALGVGRDRFAEADAAPSLPRPKKGDVAAVARRIAADFGRAYFVAGQLDDGVYDPDCRFADPTVAFRGVRLWRRNLALLTPFLIEPRIDLLPPEEGGEGGSGGGAAASSKNNATNPLAPLLSSLFGGGGSARGASASSSSAASRVVRLGPVGPGGAEVLRARWYLETALALPWRPVIRLKGSTDYTLDREDANRVVNHVESWEISGTEALLQLFKPGGGGGQRRRD